MEHVRVDPSEAAKIMRREAYEFLSEAEACINYVQTNDEWCDMHVKLLIMLAETKEHCADFLDILGKIKGVSVEQSGTKALPAPLTPWSKPPFDEDFFNERR